MPRFYRSPTWKHILTDRDSVGVAEMTRLLRQRVGRWELGGPATIEGVVKSDDPRVYLPVNDNFTRSAWDPFYYPSGAAVDLPRLSEGVRFLYSFRREAPGVADPWVIRHAGIVLFVRDESDPTRKTTRFMALDPWAYLFARPCRRADSDLVTPDPNVNPMPGEQGVVFPAGTPGNEIVAELLRRSIEEDGLTYIDAGAAWGGTADYAGTIQATETFLDPIIFPRGTSVGQAWQQLVDTGTLDIVLKPIWDPINRPGYLAELNIYQNAGGSPADAYTNGYPTFRWDRTAHNLVSIGRQIDGRERANRIRAFTGGTGAASNPWDPPGHLGDIDTVSPDTEATWSSSTSAQRFGESWYQQTYTRQTAGETVGRQAADDLFRRNQGLRTWTFAPTPEFSPRPWLDYDLGSYVGFYHSHRLREEQWWIPENFNDQELSPRVFGWSIDMDDNALETVTELDISIDNPISSLIV